MEKTFNDLVRKIKKNITEIDGDLADFSGTCDGKYFENRQDLIRLSHIFNWTQSFFTGMAYWAFKVSKDTDFIKWNYRFYQDYYDKVFKTPMDTMHDLGFLYTPYAVAMYEATNDSKMKEIGIKAADELAKRFDPKGRYIQAWGRMDDIVPDYVSEKIRNNIFFTDSKGMAIIDCMMNLPLLFWAGEVTGHQYYKKIAECHADTTLKYFVRDDYSVCHAYRFDPETGEALREDNDCGYSVGSHWARGTAWAVYGFTIAYSYTKKEEYLNTAINLLKKFIEECGDEMPVWDFRLPESEEPNIDTSAIAVMLCAVRLISKFVSNEKIERFEDVFSKKILDYVDLSLDNNGILREQNGRRHYTSYGDYFLVEYLCLKYKDMKTIW